MKLLKHWYSTCCFRENIVQVEAFFGEMKYTQTKQVVDYGIGDFFSKLLLCFYLQVMR